MMIKEMLEYLKLKKEIALGKDFSLEEDFEKQKQFLNTLSAIMKYEEMFLVVDKNIQNTVETTLDFMMRSENNEVRAKAKYYSFCLDNIKSCVIENPDYINDYLQWITTVRTNQAKAISIKEQLEYIRCDDQIMEILLSEDWYQLVRNNNFISTLNYTINIFHKVYRQNPYLLDRSQVIIEENMLENNTKAYKRRAIKMLKYIEKYKSKMDDPKIYSKRV